MSEPTTMEMVAELADTFDELTIDYAGKTWHMSVGRGVDTQHYFATTFRGMLLTERRTRKQDSRKTGRGEHE